MSDKPEDKHYTDTAMIPTMEALSTADMILILKGLAMKKDYEERYALERKNWAAKTRDETARTCRAEKLALELAIKIISGERGH